MTELAERLLKQAQSGDPAALGQLLEQHQDRLYRVCLRMVSHRDDAAEVCQETMLRIVQHISEFRAEAKLTTWMTRIAMNQSISHLRKRKIRQTISLDAVNSENPGGNSGGSSGGTALRNCLAEHREPEPSQHVQTQEQVQRLEAAIASLEVDFRSVLVLRDLDGMDYQQIAETLEMKVGTVKSRLFRARLALRQAMIKAEHGPMESKR